MANKNGKTIDTTHLSIETALTRGFLHRDYIAHCFRWSYVLKYMLQSKRFVSAKVLDVGCGVDVQMARTLYSSRLTNREGIYIGVDVNKLEVPKMLKDKSYNIKVFGETDICNFEYEHKFDVVTSFEVLEHVEPEHCVRILQKVMSLMEDDGIFIMSTPCYDKQTGAADNHVNEITYETLGSLLEFLGYNTDTRFGTFASQKDYKHLIYSDRSLGKLFDKLSDYYDSNVLATIFAPLYPELSRNCIWHLKKGSSNNFKPFEEHIKVNKNFGSSSIVNWEKAFKLLGV